MRFFATMLFLIPLCAQQPKEGGKRPPPEPKNLKVLKIAPSELIPTMRSYAAALGEECSYCHMGRDFASDENPKKEIARMMITMAQEVNAKFHDGKVHVTCYTCHRGKEEPLTAPPPAESKEH